MMAIRHDDFCRTRRWRFQRCTCGAEETQRIVDETGAKFGEELKKIMAADDHCDQCAAPVTAKAGPNLPRAGRLPAILPQGDHQ